MLMCMLCIICLNDRERERERDRLTIQHSKLL
jgi:hypothetical protein